MAVKITENSVKATKLKKELEEPEASSTQVVGFTIPIKEEEEEEEYEDDE